jgi:hypothetical protein
LRKHYFLMMTEVSNYYCVGVGDAINTVMIARKTRLENGCMKPSTIILFHGTCGEVLQGSQSARLLCACANTIAQKISIASVDRFSVTTDGTCAIVTSFPLPNGALTAGTYDTHARFVLSLPSTTLLHYREKLKYYGT